jgi:DNA-binding transcriptional regulator PaaX
MQMLDERISMELDVIDASRDAKEAVAKEKSRQKTAEWRLEQLARQQAEVDAELSKMNKAILKEQVFSHLAAAVSIAPDAL